MIDVLLYHRRLNDREYSTEDAYEVCSCPLVVQRNCRCDAPLRHKDVAHFWQCCDDEEEQDAVQGCSPKGPGVKVIVNNVSIIT